MYAVILDTDLYYHYRLLIFCSQILEPVGGDNRIILPDITVSPPDALIHDRVTQSRLRESHPVFR